VSQAERLKTRVGSRRRSEIPADVLKLLNQGKLETVNLVEFLAVDQLKLFRATRNEIGLPAETANRIGKRIKNLQDAGIMQRVSEGGQIFFEEIAEDRRVAIYDAMANHESDSLRNWAAFMDGANTKLTFAKRIQRAKQFADDRNMGVREIAWMCVRSPAADALIDQIERLLPFAKSKKSNLRRFAIELTRPCGVWCKHLPRLKERPEIALPLLELCKDDPIKYVQDSVANWLNDASKTREDFVIETTQQWLDENDSKATARIVHRARRTLRKQGKVD